MPVAVDSAAIAGGWQRLLPSWPWIVGLLFFARLLAARTALLNDPDTYLHIAAGRWILAHGALPNHDAFSHSMPGAAWVSGEWLAQVALAAVYDHFGWSGVVLLTAAAAAIAAGLLTHFLLRQLPALPALIATAAAVALLEAHILARPHVLALPLLVLWCGLLLAARDAGRRPPFAALPVIALWANLHASFLFGLALAAFLAGEAVLRAEAARRRAEIWRWGGFVAAALLAALLTPHGLVGILQPLRLMEMPALQATFVEWLSPNFQQAPDLELWILAAVFIGFATGVRLPLTRLLLLLGLLHMALQHVRHADVLAIVAPLAVAAPLGQGIAALHTPSRLADRFARLARPPTVVAAVLTIVVAAALALPIVVHPIVRGDDKVTPAAALAAAQRLGLTGPVLNSEEFGGYLIYRGVPTFVDGRIEMYGNDFLAADVAAERGDSVVLEKLLAHYRIAWTLLLPHSGAAENMAHLSGWQQVYADKWAVVFRRAAGSAGG